METGRPREASTFLGGGASRVTNTRRAMTGGTKRETEKKTRTGRVGREAI